MEQHTDRFLLELAYHDTASRQPIPGQTTMSSYPSIYHAFIALHSLHPDLHHPDTATKAGSSQYLHSAKIIDLVIGLALASTVRSNSTDDLFAKMAVFLELAPRTLANYFKGASDLATLDLVGDFPIRVPLYNFDPSRSFLCPSPHINFMIDYSHQAVYHVGQHMDNLVWNAEFYGFLRDEIKGLTTGFMSQPIAETHEYASEREALAKFLSVSGGRFDPGNSGKNDLEPYYYRAALFGPDSKDSYSILQVSRPNESNNLLGMDDSGRHFYYGKNWKDGIEKLQLPSTVNLQALPNSPYLKLDYWNTYQPPQLRPTDTYEKIMAGLAEIAPALQQPYEIVIREHPNIHPLDDNGNKAIVADVIAYAYTDNLQFALGRLFRDEPQYFIKEQVEAENLSHHMMEAALKDANGKTMITLRMNREDDSDPSPGLYACFRPDMLDHPIWKTLHVDHLLHRYIDLNREFMGMPFIRLATFNENGLNENALGERIRDAVFFGQHTMLSKERKEFNKTFPASVAETDSHFVQIEWQRINEKDPALLSPIIYRQGFPNLDNAMHAMSTFPNGFFQSTYMESMGTQFKIKENSIWDCQNGEKLFSKKIDSNGGMTLELNYDHTTLPQRLKFQEMATNQSSPDKSQGPTDKPPPPSPRMFRTDGDNDKGIKPSH